MDLGWLLLIVIAALAVVALVRNRPERIDPVCGMEVAADAPYITDYEGRRYRFCTRSCLEKFQADPERWLSRPQGPP